jgi:hypothetical protein
MRLHHRRWKPGAVIALAVLSVLVEIVGCSDLLGIQSERHLADSGTMDDVYVADVADVADEDAAPPGPWDCLTTPLSLAPVGASVTVTVQVLDALKASTRAAEIDGGSALDILSATFLSGVQVRACPAILDPSCTMSGTPWQTTDDAGSVQFPLMGSFDGFFLVNRPDLLPYRFYPGPIPAGPSAIVDPLAVVSQAGAQEIVAALGTNAAPSFDAGSGLGLIFVSTYDCNDHFAPGVSFGISQPANNTIVFYATGSGGFPSTSATATQQLGAAGFLNVPATSQTIHATLQATLQPIASVTAEVYPATVTQVFIRARTMRPTQ